MRFVKEFVYLQCTTVVDTHMHGASVYNDILLVCLHQERVRTETEVVGTLSETTGSDGDEVEPKSSKSSRTWDEIIFTGKRYGWQVTFLDKYREMGKSSIGGSIAIIARG